MQYSPIFIKQAPKGHSKCNCLRQVLAYTVTFQCICLFGGSLIHTCLIHDACSVEVTSKTGFTVYNFPLPRMLQNGSANILT